MLLIISEVHFNVIDFCSGSGHMEYVRIYQNNLLTCYLSFGILVNHFPACLCTSATKKRMQSVANISVLAMFVMYLLTALFGYLTFYGNVF